MRLHLRFAMHKDIPLIRSESDKLDGLVIPGHILAYQSAPTSVFVAAMPQLDYVIDPMTFLLQHDKCHNCNDGGDIRASVKKMCEAYHPDLLAILEAIDPEQRLTPSNFPSTSSLCKHIVSFQTECVAQRSSESKAAKYIERYTQQRPTAPRLVLSPYFRFTSVEDPWYAYSLECAKETQRICEGRPMAAVVFCPVTCLTQPTMARIAADYRTFQTLFLWFDGFDPRSVTAAEITQARSLIDTLNADRETIETLYGGYLLMLMQREGLSSISHGILFTQYKNFDTVPGGGGVPERYYIPAFRGFRSLSQTDLILHRHPELLCDCEICQEVMGGDVDRFLLFSDEPELLRKHFLTVRRREVDSLNNGETVTEAIEDMRRVYSQYHKQIAQLPNPDAFVSRSRMRGLQYLQVWAEGLSTPLP